MGLGITAIAQDAISSLGTPNTIAAVTGVSLTSAVGSTSLKITGSVQVTGNSLTTAVGQAQTDPDVIATGQQLNTGTGSVSTTGSATVSLTGIPMTINLGNS